MEDVFGVTDSVLANVQNKPGCEPGVSEIYSRQREKEEASRTGIEFIGRERPSSADGNIE